LKEALVWVMATRWRASAVTAALALLPFTGMLASALLALVVLLHGLREGLLVALVAAGGVAVLDLLAGTGTGRVVALLAINWLPVIGLAAVLARTVSLARTLQIAGIAGIGVVVGVFAAAGGDPAEFWLEVLRDRVLPLLEQIGMPMNREVMDEALPQMAMLMTGLAAAFWAVGHFITLLLGRWWQARLVNPGGFRMEFHSLRLGGAATMIGSLGFIAGMLLDSALLTNVALVLVMMFAIQGLAVLHGVAGNAKLHWGWLVPPYVFLVMLPPHMVALLAVMGFIDHWVDFRGRIGKGIN